YAIKDQLMTPLHERTVHHLNAISGFSEDLQAYSAGRCSNFSSKIRRNSIIIGVLFVGIPLVTVLPAISWAFSEGVVLAPVIIREVSTILLHVQLVLIYVDDADITIQCDIVCEFYRQMEIVLIDTKEYLRGNHGSVLLVEVRKWHQFLLRNRRIVGQIGTITKIPQLLSLVEVTMNLTVFWYTVFTLVASTNTPLLENYPLKMSMSYVVISLIRLHVKTRKAENVTAAENHVHDALFALNEFPQVLEVQLELQGMRNTISSTPSRIAFGNYAVLHNGVILTAQFYVNKLVVSDMGMSEYSGVTLLFDFEKEMVRPIDQYASAREVNQFYTLCNFIVPVIRITVIVHQLINIKGTVNQLNTISRFADDLQTHSAAQFINFSSKIRRNSIMIVAILVGIPLVIFSPIIVYSFSNSIVTAPMIMREAVVFLIPLQLVSIYFDDADFIVQCDIVSEFFRQIEMVLISKEDNLSRNCCSVHLTEVRKWHQFLLRNRRIVDQIGTTTKIPQILALLEVTTNLTLFVYTVCKLVTSSGTSIVENFVARTVTIYVVVCFIRLYFKTRKAENVTAAEVRVHDALFALNEFPQALEVQLELQGMRNTITTTPSRIAFGNYVILHKGVIITVFAQVVTYLIVLLQFDNARS
ncbi:unnamed protein product, partial [Allacma fusca]